MFGKEQPDVVTEEEVGEYIEQLKRDGMEDLNLTDRKECMCHTFKVLYGTSPLQAVQGDSDELARISEDSTSGTQVKK